MDDRFKNDIEERNETMSEEEARKLGRVQFLILALLFFAVLAISGIASMVFGKNAGTAALVITALFISAFLYRDEIKARLGKK